MCDRPGDVLRVAGTADGDGAGAVVTAAVGDVGVVGGGGLVRRGQWMGDV